MLVRELLKHFKKQQTRAPSKVHITGQLPFHSPSLQKLGMLCDYRDFRKALLFLKGITGNSQCEWISYRNIKPSDCGYPLHLGASLSLSVNLV